MKRKLLTMLTALTLALTAAPALAQTAADGLTYSGQIEYTQTVTVTAPFGGTLADYTLRVGDAVTAGETLFTLTTTKVYAPADGTVRGLRAQAGDDAKQVTDRYGALMYVEPAGKYTIDASTAGAYDSESTHNRNRYLNPGDVVYFQSEEDDVRTGDGVVTTVNGRSFTIEVLHSNLDPEDKVTVYQSESFATSARIARSARVQQAQNLAVTAEGSVLRLSVAEGQSVKRGDLLLETVSGTLAGLAPAEDTVTAPADGVVVSVLKTAGSDVNAEEPLATLYPQSSLKATFLLDEGDLDDVQVGQASQITFDNLPDRAPLHGTVAAVASMPAADGSSPQYTVYVALEDTAELRDGMSVTVHLQ